MSVIAPETKPFPFKSLSLCFFGKRDLSGKFLLESIKSLPKVFQKKLLMVDEKKFIQERKLQMLSLKKFACSILGYLFALFMGLGLILLQKAKQYKAKEKELLQKKISELIPSLFRKLRDYSLILEIKDIFQKNIFFQPIKPLNLDEKKGFLDETKQLKLSSLKSLLKITQYCEQKLLAGVDIFIDKLFDIFKLPQIQEEKIPKASKNSLSIQFASIYFPSEEGKVIISPNKTDISIRFHIIDNKTSNIIPIQMRTELISFSSFFTGSKKILIKTFWEKEKIFQEQLDAKIEQLAKEQLEEQQRILFLKKRYTPETSKVGWRGFLNRSKFIPHPTFQ